MNAVDLEKSVEALGDSEQACILQRFFKTGPGEYGEGDVFLGLRVPQIRLLAKNHHDLSLPETVKLLHSRYHEVRLLALLIMVRQFQRGDEAHQRRLYEAYLRNTSQINNWDLVDLSAEHIVGGYLLDRDRNILGRLARSRQLWERRISVLATFHFIKRGDFADTLKVADILLQDKHDLIHKAVGWMLREVGKRDQDVEEAFLKPRYQTMPRTMLRYAIERFEENQRQQYLKGLVSAD